MLRYMGAIDDSTPVVTSGRCGFSLLNCSYPVLFIKNLKPRVLIFYSYLFAVHDCQLVDDIPVEKLLIHDVPVDIICTPTQLIYTSTSIPKPQGR